MQKIDAHQHFWNLQKFPYPWLKPEAGVLYRNYEPAGLAPELAATGIDGTIAVQFIASPAETEWLLALAKANSFIKGVVGGLDFAAYNLDEQLDKLLATGPLCGLRFRFQNEPSHEWALPGKVARGLRLVADKELACDLLLWPPQLKNLPVLFEAAPEGRWIINHLAKPPIKSGEMEPWLSDLRQASYYPNVYCKLSGLLTEADLNKDILEQIRPYFEHALELFGPSRLLFGSDWPMSLRAESYSQTYSIMESLISTLTPEAQAAIWGETALAVYKLGDYELGE
jgi:L-fuconolactonase